MVECTYCGSDLASYDPLRVTDADDVERGRFCNWACLREHIDDACLAEGAACEWTPGES